MAVLTVGAAGVYEARLMRLVKTLTDILDGVR